MLFQPAIIALLLASGVAVAMLAAAAPFAVQVIRQWDIASGSERQLALERRTYLFSTLAVFVMAVQLVALLLSVWEFLQHFGLNSILEMPRLAKPEENESETEDLLKG